MNPNQTLRGYGLILFAAVLFGTTGTARMLGTDTLAPWITGAFRLLIGGPILLTICLIFKPAGTGNAGEKFPWGAVLGGSVGVVIFQLAFFEAVTRAGVATGTLVAIGSAPVFAGLLGALFHKEPLDRTWLLSMVLAVAGCLLLVTSGQEIHMDIPGICLALAAGVGYAVYVAVSRTLVRMMAPAKAVGIILSIGGLMMLPLLCMSDLSGLADPGAVITLAYLGIFATAISYFCLTAGLVHVPISGASVLLLAEPMVGSLLGICLLKEPFTLLSGLGMVLIFSGMAVVAVCQRPGVKSSPRS